MDIMTWLQEQTKHYNLNGITKVSIKLIVDIYRLIEEKNFTKVDLLRKAKVKRKDFEFIFNDPEKLTLGTMIAIANALDAELKIELKNKNEEIN